MTQQNYLSYSALSFGDSRAFMGADLHFLLNKARAHLYKQKISQFYCTFESLNHRTEDLASINSHIEYILGLIGQHSNKRFGETAQQQHAFFTNRPFEHETFFLHLFIAIQKHKQLAMPNAIDMPAPFINDAHLELKKREKPNAVFFTVNRNSVTEKQLYAAGVFYATGFVFQAVKDGDALRTSKIMARILHFMTGPSYLAAYGSKGGSRNGKAKHEKDQAYRIFEEEGIYEKCGGKVASITEDLIVRLEAVGISRSTYTIEKHWVPEFIKRHKRNIQEKGEH